MKRNMAVLLSVSVLFVIGQYVTTWYYRSDLWKGIANNPLPTYPGSLNEFGGLLLLAVFIFGLKYMLYDISAQQIERKYHNTLTSAVYWAAILVAIWFDLMIMKTASAPQADAGLAIIGSIIFTPIILMAGLVTLWAIRYITTRKTR